MANNVVGLAENKLRSHNMSLILVGIIMAIVALVIFRKRG